MKNRTQGSLLPQWDELFSILYEPEALRDEPDLRVSSINVDKIVEKNTRLFLQLRAKANAEANSARFEAAKNFIVKMQEGLKNNVAAYKQLADEILSKPKFAQLSPMFRNLDQVSKSDSLDMLIDAKILDLLEQLQNDVKSEFNDDAASSNRG